MSWRRLRVLIQHLPPESATWTALRNSLSEEELAEQADEGEPEQGRWSQEEQLLAVIADRVADVGFVLRAVNSDSKAKAPKPPDPIRRPGAKPLRPKPRMSEAQANHLFAMLNGGAA